MTECKTYCDHCGAELDDMKDYPDINISVYAYSASCDLCEKCYNELKAIVGEFVSEMEGRGGDEAD